jgi:hypothetical protein
MLVTLSRPLWAANADPPSTIPIAELGFGADFGIRVVQVVDESATGETGPVRRYDETAPMLGAAIGVDWPVARRCCALGPELRAFSFLFGGTRAARDYAIIRRS